MDRRPIPLPPRWRLMARGFTAIELLVVIAVLAVLAALAAPSFVPLMEKWRVRQVSEALQSSLYFARSEAIKRGGGVAIHKLPNAGTSADWSSGWQICIDANNNNKCDAAENILQRYDTPPQIEVERTVSSGASFGFNRWGAANANIGLGFNVVPKDKGISNPASRGVCMSAGGRVRPIPSEKLPCNTSNIND